MKRARYWLYRAIGQSDTQARWRLRRGPKPVEKPRVHRHRNCASCGQLLLIEDRSCHRCGAVQVSPGWLLNLSRRFDVGAEVVIPLITGLCLFGYLAQIAMGGSFFGGLAVKDPMQQRYILMVGAGLPIPLGDYFSATHGWRLFTYTCMHGNLMHIGFNMVALLQIGPLIANTFGFTRTLFIWVASGALAIILPSIIVTPSLVVGASGSVFGLIGVAMAYGHRVGTPQGIHIRNKMIEWTVFCTLFGLMMGGIAHSAHFGGLIGGALLSFVIPPPKTNTQHALSPILLASAVIFIIWSVWSAWQVYSDLF